MRYLDFWRHHQRHVFDSGIRALPGLIIIGLVVLARFTGSLQFLEWMAFDYLLRFRPSEAQDQRIVIISIDAQQYPIPRENLVELIRILQAQKPAVIGLSILGDRTQYLQTTKLFTDLGSPSNLISVDKVFPPIIPAPPGFPPKQVGFSDVLNDQDGHLRRMLLGTPNPINPDAVDEYKFSLAVRLSEQYLSAQGYFLTNGIRDENAMRFGAIELPRFLANTGGYIQEDDGGVQMLINFRTGDAPFRILSSEQIRRDDFDSEWIKNNIVIIGITDPKISPPISTLAVPSSEGLFRKVNSVEIQAHAVSQIVSFVLDERPFLQSWPEPIEYLWIVAWSFLGIAIFQPNDSLKKKLLCASGTILVLIGIAYAMLLSGWWIPIAPPLLALALVAAQYSAFKKYEKLKFQLGVRQHIIEERQRTIEHTFYIIHSGPLQTLANILKKVKDRNISEVKLITDLEYLNSEIRKIGEHLKQEIPTQGNSLYLQNGARLHLELPIHELFYEVYRNTLERDFSGFTQIIIRVRDFDPINVHIPNDHKQALCRFLEEAICNVGKHANRVTQLKVVGFHRENWYVLQIEDNGLGTGSFSEGEGTRQAQKLSMKLQGTFRRVPLSPRGVLCELAWPLSRK